MVTIRQHGSSNELFDIARFLTDVDMFGPPDTGHITVDWCVGGRATEIEQLTESGYSLPDDEFRSLYCGVRQTIDGRFVGLFRGERLFELAAVDSSFWEVTGSPSFETHMLVTYGAWQALSPGATE